MLMKSQLVTLATLFLATCTLAGADEAVQRKVIGSIVRNHRCDYVRAFYQSKAMGREQAYALFVPKSYDPSTPKPVVVFLHSWYDRFDEKQWLRAAEIPGTIQNQCNERGWIAVGPEAGGNTWYYGKSEQQVLETIDEIRRYVNVDPNRLILVGRSMGGAGALTIAAHYPERVAGVVALAGVSDYVEYVNGNPGLLLGDSAGSVKTAFGGTPDSNPKAYRHMSAIYAADKLRGVPVYLIHGDKDQINPPSHSRKLVPLLKKAGVPVVYKEVKDQEHNMEMIEWFAPEYFRFLEANSEKLKGEAGSRQRAAGSTR